MKYRSIAALTLLFLLPLAAFQGTSRRASADDPIYYSNYAKVTLGDLRTNPTSFKTAHVRFQAYFYKIESIFSPFYTPFLPEQYIAFSVWEGNKKLWLKKDRMSDFPFCFMRKDNKYLAEITTLPKYTPIEIIATVANDFNNTPWLEIDTAHATGGLALTDKSLHHVVAGYEYLNNGQPALAEHEYWEALKYKLPDEAHLTVLQELAKIAFEARRWKEAEEYAHQVMAMDKDSQIGNDIYRAAREEIIRAYNTGAPHGMNGPTGTDNSHPIPAEDTRGRRGSEAPSPLPKPTVAQADPKTAPDTAARLASSQLRIAELEKLLDAREKTLADRGASLAEKEAELLGLRREHEKNLEDQARYTSEVANYRDQLASLQVERDRMMDGKLQSNETMKKEVEALEARKADIEKLLSGRDQLAAEMEKRGQDLESCKTELAGLMTQRDAVTKEIGERKSEVETILAKRDGLAKELGGRKTELEQAITAREGKAQELDARVHALEARKAEVEGLVTRTEGSGKANDEIAKILADRKAELEGILSRRESMTKELEERARALESAKSEVQAALGERDRLTREVEASKAALASAAEPKNPPTATQPTSTPDLSEKLSAVTARQDELVAEAAKLSGQLAQRDTEIAGLKRDLTAGNLRLSELEREAGGREQKIVSLQSEVARVKSLFQRQGDLLRDAAEKMGALEARLNGAGSAETPEQIWRGRRIPSGRRTPEEIGK